MHSGPVTLQDAFGKTGGARAVDDVEGIFRVVNHIWGARGLALCQGLVIGPALGLTVHDVAMAGLEMQEFILKWTQTFYEVRGCKCLCGAAVVDQGSQLLTC